MPRRARAYLTPPRQILTLCTPLRRTLCLCCFILALALSAPSPALAQAEPDLAEPDLAHMAGQMIMAGFRGMAIAPKDPIALALAQGKAGGVILFSRDALWGGQRNIQSPRQLKALITEVRAAAPGPIFVAVDQEGGKVQRLKAANGFSDWPSARSLGQGAPEHTRRVAQDLGAELAGAGFDINFAPVVDLDLPGSPAISGLDRAFSSDPAKVAAHARAFIDGLASQRIIPALKHFPGHGSATGDTHAGLVDISRTWTPRELEPYKDLIAQGFSGIIMVAHVTLGPYGDLPADLNPAIVNGLLRHDLNWQGVVATDDLQMGAIADLYSLEQTILLAVQAGVDLLVFGNNTIDHDPNIAAKAHAALMDHIRAGRIAPERIRESWLRIQRLRAD